MTAEPTSAAFLFAASWRTVLEFTIAGRPAPSGSKTAYPGRKRPNGRRRMNLVDCGGDARKAWMEATWFYASQRYNGPLLAEPVRVTMLFVMPRPLDHYIARRRDRPLRHDAPTWHVNTPDLGKLERGTIDALSGVIWKDDRYVVAHGDGGAKRYGVNTGARVRVEVLA